MKMRRLSPLAALVVGLLSCLLVAATLSSPTAQAASPTAAAQHASAKKKDPSQDFPHMPQHCATRKEKIPTKAVICNLVRFHYKNPTIVLWGDSHAWMMIPALKRVVQDQDINLVATVMGSCPPMDPQLADGETAVPCDQNNDMALKYVEKLNDGDKKLMVVLGGSWQRYYHALQTHDTSDYVGKQAVKMKQQTPVLFKELAQQQVPVFVDGQVATVPEKRDACKRGYEPYSCDLPKKKSLPEVAGTKRMLAGFMKPLPGNPKALDVNGDLCDKSECHGYIDGVHTWFDDLHLSASRSRMLAKYFQPIATELLAQDTTTDPDPQPNPDPGCTLIVIC